MLMNFMEILVSQGRSSSARTFDLVHPVLLSPLSRINW